MRVQTPPAHNAARVAVVVLELLKREDKVISDTIASQMSGWYTHHGLNENGSRAVRFVSLPL